MTRRCRLFALLIALAAPGPAPAEPPTPPEAVEFFERKVRPVLVEHCAACHSGEPGKRKGGLSLASRAAVRRGGDRGPAVVAGKPGESLLIQAIRHSDEALRMPPKGRLPEAVIADLERWVQLGAPDPREETATP